MTKEELFRLIGIDRASLYEAEDLEQSVIIAYNRGLEDAKNAVEIGWGTNESDVKEDIESLKIQ